MEMEIRDLGLIPHPETDVLMRSLQKQRLAEEIPDTILFCVHPEVVTVGPRARNDGIAAPDDYPHADVDRGGGLTWHGPGQVVVYPIILWNRDDERNVAQVIHRLEEWIITALSTLDIEAGRDERMQGVWVDGHKVASIGLAFLRWVSRHGLTINVDTPVGRVEGLAGCGLESSTTTCLKALGYDLTVEQVKQSLLDTCALKLHRDIS